MDGRTGKWMDKQNEWDVNHMITVMLRAEKSKAKVPFPISTCHPDVFQPPKISLGK